MAGRYRIQEGIVDSSGITLGFKGLDAQAVFPLSTSEGQQKTRKRPTRERQQPCTCIKINKHWMQA